MADADLALDAGGSGLALGDEFLQTLTPFANDGCRIEGEGLFELADEEVVHDVDGGEGGPVKGGAQGGLSQGDAAGRGEIDGDEDALERFHKVGEC